MKYLKGTRLIGLTKIFKEQLPDLPVGGFYNPKIVWEDEKEIEFMCSYDNYESIEDSWTWYYVKDEKKFYN